MQLKPNNLLLKVPCVIHKLVIGSNWMSIQKYDQHRGADQEFLILSKSFYNQNNLPKDLTDQVTQLIHQSQWQVKQSDADERQANTLDFATSKYYDRT